MSMEEYSESILYLELKQELLKQEKERATDSERTSFKSLAGDIMWLGGGVSLQLTFVTSYSQQSTSELRVNHMKEAKTILKQLKNLPTTLRYPWGADRPELIYYHFLTPLLTSRSCSNMDRLVYWWGSSYRTVRLAHSNSQSW